MDKVFKFGILPSPVGYWGIFWTDDKKILRVKYVGLSVFLRYSFLTSVPLWLYELWHKALNDDYPPEIELAGNISDFCSAVYSVVKAIPKGSTLTYKQVALKLKRKTSPRAVAMALKHNKWPVFIPCHRVVSKRKIGGYAGKRLIYIKKALLYLEGSLGYK